MASGTYIIGSTQSTIPQVPRLIFAAAVGMGLCVKRSIGLMTTANVSTPDPVSTLHMGEVERGADVGAEMRGGFQGCSAYVLHIRQLTSLELA